MKLERSGLHVLVLATAACLSRPISPSEPTTKNSFQEETRSQSVDKIDLLLAIDNSASMKDKQDFLADAVPRLVARLVTPSCVLVSEDGTSTPTGTNARLDASGEGTCEDGAKPEFKPITDIHVGVISSSLGNFGATDPDNVACDQTNADDHAQLLRRGGAGKIEDSNFLAWFPDVQANHDPGDVAPAQPYADANDPAELSGAFAELVKGVDDEGCGLEAQLESMYQFLIAPQPWSSIVVDDQLKASYEGINETVLKQRSDFLRPDSLVAVIMLTDEDDSSVDPLSFNRQGHLFMRPSFPQDERMGTPTARTDGTQPAPRGTAICATDPASPDCKSCAFGDCPPDETYHTDDDGLNVRFHDLKRRFGVDPQYPIQRYVNGLHAREVPSRDAEHRNGAYDIEAADCINPLFAGAKLPTRATDELCKIATGTPRDPSLVFFALVGGVPNELIAGDARNATGQLTTEAWTSILGANPAAFQDTHDDGKDWRMVQTTALRGDRPNGGEDDTENDALNTSFRDWDTKGGDLQYACTFPVPSPTAAKDTIDCGKGSDAPLCAAGDKSQAREQIRAKAYPTIREAWLVKELEGQGILASLCPQNPTEPTRADYGYAPAVDDIVNRLKSSLTASCIPRELERDVNGKVPCLMLELMPDGLDCTGDGRDRGRTEAPQDVADQLKTNQQLPASAKVCELTQDTTAESSDACQTGDGGWCYLDGAAAGRCQQQIVFNDSVLNRAKGSRVYLQCISQAAAN